MQVWEGPLGLLSYWPTPHLSNKYLRRITVCRELAMHWEDEGGQDDRCVRAARRCLNSGRTNMR